VFWKVEGIPGSVAAKTHARGGLPAPADHKTENRSASQESSRIPVPHSRQNNINGEKMKNLDNVRPRMKPVALILLFLCSVAIARAGAQLTIDSFDGPVTQNEINSFRSFVQTLTPPSSNSGNAWSQGGGGEQTRGMGLVYEATGDVGILDQEIRFCDAVLSERNDLASAPVGQHVIWTGRIDPVWPNSFGTTIGTGGEQGYVGGHLGNCARHILQTPAIWNTTVAIGDPHHFGATYLARGKTFLAGVDAAIDGHILRSQLNLSDHNHYHFASGDPYKGGLAVPWNQTMMFNYLFSNAAWAHAILGDDPARVAQYDAIVQANLDWFFTTGSSSYTDKAGNTAYNWAYTLPNTTGEDAEEGQWDVDGFYRLWVSGRYQFPTSKMVPFANTFVDVMTLGPNSYAGRVDGTSGSGHSAHTTTIHQGWLLLADLRPDAYHSMMAADLPSSGSTGSMQDYNRFLWVKNRRFQSGQTPDFIISPSPASQTVTVGGSTSYTVTVSPIHNFTGTVNLGVSGLPSGATATFNPTSITTSGSSTLSVATTSSTPPGTYTLTISGTSSGIPAHMTTVMLTVNQLPDFSISAAPASQTVTAGNGTSYNVTITAINGFTGMVTFAAGGLPAGASASFNPTTITGSGSLTLTVNTGTATPAATSTLTIGATGGGLSHSAMVSLVVTPPSVCTTATNNGMWNNSAFPSHSGTFTATFDAMPSISSQSSAVGISHGTQGSISGFANIVAFSTSGVIQARNGGGYFNSTVKYSGGNSYHFRLVINVSNHTYLVFVTPPGGSEVQIGTTSFAFRTEQNMVTSLDHWGDLVNTTSSGTLRVCNFTAQ
jgi:hypothetical protein